MRARAAIVAGLLAAAVPLDSPAQAQFSPRRHQSLLLTLRQLIDPGAIVNLNRLLKFFTRKNHGVEDNFARSQILNR